jgi:hypothetical protein
MTPELARIPSPFLRSAQSSRIPASTEVSTSSNRIWRWRSRFAKKQGEFGCRDTHARPGNGACRPGTKHRLDIPRWLAARYRRNHSEMPDRGGFDDLHCRSRFDAAAHHPITLRPISFSMTDRQGTKSAADAHAPDLEHCHVPPSRPLFGMSGFVGFNLRQCGTEYLGNRDPNQFAGAGSCHYQIRAGGKLVCRRRDQGPLSTVTSQSVVVSGASRLLPMAACHAAGQLVSHRSCGTRVAVSSVSVLASRAGGSRRFAQQETSTFKGAILLALHRV